MAILSPTRRRPDFHPAVASNTGRRFSLIRTFVETGDERCPIAGIWSRLVETDATADDPELTPPAMRSLFPWRAFLSLAHAAPLL
jgi:hypothetical protein